MKTKSIVKIVLDIVMTALFIPLLFAYNTGLVFHEIMGISIIFLFVLHLILNRKWIVNTSKNLFTGKIKSKTLLMYFLNIGLFLGISFILITGIMISNIIFPVNSYSQILVTIHKWSSYITAVMIAVHLVLHAEYLAASFKKILSNIKTSNTKRIFQSALAIIMIAGIVYYNIISATNKNINSTTNTNSSSQNSKTITSIPSTKRKEDENETTISSSEDQTDVISLSDFLSKMFCTMCPRNCPLSSPQCGKSKLLIEDATAEYQSLYGESN